MEIIELLAAVFGGCGGITAIAAVRIAGVRQEVRLHHLERMLEKLSEEFKELKEEFLRRSGAQKQAGK